MPEKTLHIPYSRSWITRKDIAAVNTVLRSGKVSQGSITQAFEKGLSRTVGAEDGGAVGVSSGTAALFLALRALKIGAGDDVLTPSYICQEVVEAVLATGARPVFCDTSHQWVIAVDNVRNLINKNTRAIIVPHLFGIFAQTTDFKEFGLPVIEDCSQAFAFAPDWYITGDIATFSFRWSKCFTTGEGGMAISKDPDLVSKMRQIRDGELNRPGFRLLAPISDMASALGLSQLGRYPSCLKHRRIFAQEYRQSIDRLSTSLLIDYPYDRSMFYRLSIKIPGGWKEHNRAFSEHGIDVNPGIPYLQHRNFGLPDAGFESSVDLLEQTIVFPLYPNITKAEKKYCIKAVTEVLASLLKSP